MFKDNVYLEVLVSNKKNVYIILWFESFSSQFSRNKINKFANTNCVKSSSDMNVAYITKIFKKCGTYRLS